MLLLLQISTRNSLCVTRDGPPIPIRRRTLHAISDLAIVMSDWLVYIHYACTQLRDVRFCLVLTNKMYYTLFLEALASLREPSSLTHSLTPSLTHSLTEQSSNQKQDKYSTFTFTMTSRPYIKLYPYSIPIIPNYSLTILPSAYHTQWLFPKYLPHGLRFRGSAQWPEGPLRSEVIVLANASSFVKRTLISAICCLDGQLDLVW